MATNYACPAYLIWKLAGDEPALNGSRLDILQFLSRHKFNVTEQIVAGISVFDASAGGCHMMVVEASPDGWTRDLIREILGANRPQFIVFRGAIYSEQPTWMTITDHLWTKSLRTLGFVRQDQPVIAVSASASCDAQGLPWDELRLWLSGGRWFPSPMRLNAVAMHQYAVWRKCQNGMALVVLPGIGSFKFFGDIIMSWILSAIATLVAAVGVAVTIAISSVSFENNSPGRFQGAPGPIAGAGLPLVVLIGGDYWAYRRFRKGADWIDWIVTSRPYMTDNIP
jgi:hypothetical protein